MKRTEFQTAINHLSSLAFERFVIEFLKQNQETQDFEKNVNTSGFEVDVLVRPKVQRSSRAKKELWLIEIKHQRIIDGKTLLHFNAQMQAMKKSLSISRLILVTSGVMLLSAQQLLPGLGIDVWDANYLYENASDELMLSFLGALPDKDSDATTTVIQKADALILTLQSISPGKPEALQFQKVVSDIFEFAFCPPLEPPIYESPDRDNRNRRDMIFENSASSSYWKYMRQAYSAHYIVVDAKNYSLPINKHPVLAIAHYLKLYGCGLFGMIVTRSGPSKAAEHAIKEQWIAGQKMIIVLDDSHLKSILDLKGKGGQPEEIIRKAVRDFRISL